MEQKLSILMKSPIMKTFFTIFIFLLALVQCTKQSQKITESLADTTAAMVSKNLDSLITGDSLSVFQKNIKKYEENGEAIAMYSGDDKNIKATFKSDAEGNPVVVISENGKELPWLYQNSKTDSTAIYKDENSEFTIKGNGAILIQKGKTYNLIAE